MSVVPPLAGICTYADASCAGVSVDDTVALLRRLARTEQRTLLLLAAHLGAVPEWEVKCGLALHLWQDAEHCGWLRTRVTELRKPPHHLDRPGEPGLELFFEELLRARSTRELLTGVYLVLKPSSIEAIEAHGRNANPLADYPTNRLFRFLLLEEREQVAWGEQALAALGGAEDEWADHLRGFLATDELPQPVRAAEPVHLVRVPRRDRRFSRLWNSRGRLPYDEQRSPDEVNWRMLYVRLTEMHVVELLALTLYEWPDGSFELQRDLARHLWDEARHAMFGETWFETHGVDWHAVPHELSFASFPNTELAPPERYALLYGAEHTAMRRDGKRGQYEAAAASADPLATVFQDFDWADEVLHVQIARRALAQAFATAREADEVAARMWARYEEIVEADRALPRSDWWDAFYAAAQRRAGPT